MQDPNSIFTELMDINNDIAEDFLIEPGIIIDKTNNVYHPGINIQAQGFEQPLFLSVDDLQRLAKEAEDFAEKAMKEQ